MKITNESLYTQALSKMNSLRDEIISRQKEFDGLEADMFVYQETDMWRNNRHAKTTIQFYAVLYKEWDELKSSYVLKDTAGGEK